jgi:hypothetical protein
VSDDLQVATSSYADLLSALLAARTDPATARFDAEIAAAEAAGGIDGDTARALRWWQRESLRGLTEHVVDVVPAVLSTLTASERSAADSVEGAARSWAAATAVPEQHHVDVRSEQAYNRAEDTGAPPTRLLVAGLTVLSDSSDPQDE